MKGLVDIPSAADLQSAYAFFQNDPSRITPVQLALWSQWARFDPRLAEQWVTHVGVRWAGIPSGELNFHLRAQPWPAAAGVLTEQACLFVAKDRRASSLWAKSVMLGIEPALHEQFFIGTRAFAGKQMFDDAWLSLEPYRAWGYLGRDILVNKAPQGGRTLVPEATRRSVLDELIRGRPRIRVEDYRKALGGWVAPRQAEKDLARHPKLKAVGNTRGRYYVARRGAGR